MHSANCIRGGLKKKLMEFSIKLAGWVLDVLVFHLNKHKFVQKVAKKIILLISFRLNFYQIFLIHRHIKTLNDIKRS